MVPRTNNLYHGKTICTTDRQSVLRTSNALYSQTIYTTDKDEQPILNGLERLSKPSLRRYASVRELDRVNRRLGITVLSTSQGILTGKQAQQRNLGGELLFRVW